MIKKIENYYSNYISNINKNLPLKRVGDLRLIAWLSQGQENKDLQNKSSTEEDYLEINKDLNAEIKPVKSYNNMFYFKAIIIKDNKKYIFNFILY